MTIMMKEISSMGLKVENEKLYVLDQQKIPHVEEWNLCESSEEMIDMIYKLKTRGAPLIGVSAAMILAYEAYKGTPPKVLREKAEALRKARPTAVNLMWAIDSFLPLLKDHNFSKEKVVKRGYEIFEEDIRLCEQMAENGAKLINDGDNILTHCNAGALATAGIGTAVGVIVKAHQQGKKIHVYVDETRPLLQGGRLTTYEMEKWGIPYTLICDNMAAHLMRQKRIDHIFVGADRIALNGDFANKIGTLSVATNAHVWGVPFYTVAPYTTIDPKAQTGDDIPIEERKSEEVRGVFGHFGRVEWAPENANTYNPAFDVTPRKFLSGIITDKCFYSKEDIEKGKLQEHF